MVRVETLKEFCDFVEIEYNQLLCYSKTRWLVNAYYRMSIKVIQCTKIIFSESK